MKKYFFVVINKNKIIQSGIILAINESVARDKILEFNNCLSNNQRFAINFLIENKIITNCIDELTENIIIK